LKANITNLFLTITNDKDKLMRVEEDKKDTPPVMDVMIRRGMAGKRYFFY